MTDAEPVAAPVDPTAENAGTDTGAAVLKATTNPDGAAIEAVDMSAVGSKMSDARVDAESGTSDTSNILEASPDVEAMDDATDDTTQNSESADAADSAGAAASAAGAVHRVLICGMEEHQHSVECYEKDKDDTASDDSSQKSFPGSVLSALFGLDHDASGTSDKAGPSIASGEVDDPGKTGTSGEAEDSTESSKATGSGKSSGAVQSVNPDGSIVQSVTVDGTTITAEYEEGILPADVTMQAVSVPADTYVDAVTDAVGREDTEIKTFDITFLSNGQEIEPSGEVKITFQADYIAPDTDPSVVHITDDGSADLLDTAVSDDAITLTTDSFSVYAISYTVDFHYEVNGKTYDFSIPGGGFVSLEHVVEMLGIAESGENGDSAPDTAKNDEAENGVVQAAALNGVEVSEAAKKFVADVESVEFSTPELVDVSKVEATTTVGAIKDTRGLEVEYSSDLTEEQIAEINGSTVEAGDWAMISMKPFQSDEWLTVKMTDGTKHKILVTDASNPDDPFGLDGNSYAIVNQRNGNELWYALADSIASSNSGKRGYYMDATSHSGDDGADYASEGDTLWDFEYVKSDGNTSYYRIKTSKGYLYIDPSVSDKITDMPSNGTTYAHALRLETEAGDGSDLDGTLIRIEKNGDKYSLRNRKGVALWDYGNAQFWLSIEKDEYNDSSNGEMYFCTEKPETPLPGEVTDPAKIDPSRQYLIYYYDKGSNQYYILKNDGTTSKFAGNTNLDKVSSDYLWNFSYAMYEGVPIYHVMTESEYLLLDASTSGGKKLVTSSVPDVYTMLNLYSADDEGNPLKTGFKFNQLDMSGSSSYRLTYDPSKPEEYRLVSVASTDMPDAVPIHIYWQKDRAYEFTVKTEYNNVYRGTISGIDKDNNQQTNVPSYVGITATSGEGNTNINDITAVAGPGYAFDYWRLGDSKLEGDDFSGNTIPAGKLKINRDGMVLTAVFKKVDSNTGVEDYSGLVNDWKDKLTKPLQVDKTAEVYDYDNRIYEVDITASTRSKIVLQDIQLSFVTDISRSMYFPSKLKKVDSFSNASDLFSKLDTLDSNSTAQTQSGDGDNVYYLLANESSDATLYAVRKNGSTWQMIDASYDYDSEKHALKKDAPKSGKGKNWSEPYKTTDVSNYSGSVVLVTNWKNSNSYSVTPNDASTQGADIRYSTRKTFKGEIYVAQDPVYRLAYLQQAVDIASDILYTVDKDAAVGLVTFAANSDSKKDRHGFYGIDQYNDLIAALNNITPDGGTNQKKGLNNAKGLWTNTPDPDHKRALILITDGAPNDSSDNNLNWTSIKKEASDLKKSSDYDVTLFTVALCTQGIMDGTTGISAAKRLQETATKESYGLTAESGPELVNAILEIVEQLMVEAELNGAITDTVDRAFYPVDQTGKPITQGYYNEAGQELVADADETNTKSVAYYRKHNLPYHQWFDNNDDTWSVTWYNETIGKEDDKTNTHNGVHKSFLIKAKEDFLGGNKISTNDGDAVVTATKYRTTGSTTFEDLPNRITEKATTPYVNVDELSITKSSSEITVPKGTTLYSRERVMTLYDDIRIKQLVDKSEAGNGEGGTGKASAAFSGYRVMDADGGHMIYNMMTAEDKERSYQGGNGTKDADAGVPGTIKLQELLEAIQADEWNLSEGLTEEQWKQLLQITASETEHPASETGEYKGEVKIPYYGNAAYGHGTEDHPVGWITLTLTQKTADGEQDLTVEPHSANVVGDKVETYQLTVKYTPESAAEGSYHTGNFLERTNGGQPGAETGTFKSENKHIVNVVSSGSGGNAGAPSIERNKTIDYLGDNGTGENLDNPDTTADDTSTTDENKAMKNDLYRLYLDATLKKIPTGANIILVEDYSTSMNANYIDGKTRYEVMRGALTGENGFISQAMPEEADNWMSVIRFSDDRTHYLKNGTKENGSGLLSGWTDDKTQVLNGYTDVDSGVTYPGVDHAYPNAYTSDDKSQNTADGQKNFEFWNQGAYDNSYWTDYDLALQYVDKQLNALPEDRRSNPTYVIFLSDGLPTVYMDGDYRTGGTERGGYEALTQYEQQQVYNNPYVINGKEVVENLNKVLSETVMAVSNFAGTHPGVTMSAIGFAANLENPINPSRAISGGQTQFSYSGNTYDFILKQIGQNGASYRPAKSGSQLLDALKASLKSENIDGLKIVDELSEYVTLYTNQPDFAVTRTSAGSSTSVKLSVSYDAAKKKYEVKEGNTTVGWITVSDIQTDSSGNPSGGKVTLAFDDAYDYEDGDTFTLSYNVAATTQAYSEYAEHRDNHDETDHGYGSSGSYALVGKQAEGAEGTDYPGNHTSVGKPGFHSNTDAHVSYEFKGETVKLPYEHPVIQVGKTQLAIEKLWEPEPKDGSQVTVTVQIDGTNSTTYTAELSKDPSTGKWLYTLDNLVPKLLRQSKDSNGSAQNSTTYGENGALLTKVGYTPVYYTIVEVNVPEGYSPSYEFTTTESTDGNSFSNIHCERVDDTLKYSIPGADVSEGGKAKIINTAGSIKITKEWIDGAGGALTSHPASINYEIIQVKHVHSFGAWAIDSENKPTVDAEGKEVRTCTVCGHKEYRSAGKLDHKHDWTEQSRTNATCTKPGTITFICTGTDSSGYTYTHTYSESIKPTGHEYDEGDWVIEAATKEAAGKKYRYCHKGEAHCSDYQGSYEEIILPKLEPDTVPDTNILLDKEAPEKWPKLSEVNSSNQNDTFSLPKGTVFTYETIVGGETVTEYAVVYKDNFTASYEQAKNGPGYHGNTQNDTLILTMKIWTEETFQQGKFNNGRQQEDGKKGDLFQTADGSYWVFIEDQNPKLPTEEPSRWLQLTQPLTTQTAPKPAPRRQSIIKQAMRLLSGSSAASNTATLNTKAAIEAELTRLGSITFKDADNATHNSYVITRNYKTGTLSTPVDEQKAHSINVSVPIAAQDGGEYTYFVVETGRTSDGKEYTTAYQYKTTSDTTGGLVDKGEAVITNTLQSQETPVVLKKVGMNTSDPSHTQSILPGAKFSIYTYSGNENSPLGTVVAQNRISEEGTGIFYSGQLEDGTYVIDETDTPSGYNRPGVKIKMVIAGGSVTMSYIGTVGNPDNLYNTPTKNGETWTIELINTAGVQLPATGGSGTTLFTILGSILVMLSGTGLFLWRRRRFMGIR